MHSQRPKPEHYRQQIYEKLGLDPNVKPTLKLEDPFEILTQYDKEHSLKTEENRVSSQFYKSAMWTLEDFPMLQDWLEENNVGIDLLRSIADFLYP